MADKTLQEKRKTFVDSVTEDTVNNLLDDAVSEKVLNQEEAETVKRRNVSTIEKARDLIDHVIPKGPRASQKFIDYICNRDSTLANTLGLSPVTETLAERPEVTPREDKGKLKLCPHEVFLKLQKEMGEKVYPVREKGHRTRLALIICNSQFKHLPPRTGSNHDVSGMKDLLEALDYQVQVEENLTARDMVKVLKTFASRQEHSTSDSTFLVFSSHGLLDGICGTTHNDASPDLLPYDTIFQSLNTSSCLMLMDKPKVIIIQACRGGNSGSLLVQDNSAADCQHSAGELMEDGVHKAHTEKDFIAFCSSTPHNVSWRSASSGSLFITQLVKYVQEHAWHYHLVEIFQMVQRSFERPRNKNQMPTIERQTLTKCFYLFPGN